MVSPSDREVVDGLPIRRGQIRMLCNVAMKAKASVYGISFDEEEANTGWNDQPGQRPSQPLAPSSRRS
jgi:hypothetical protein